MSIVAQSAWALGRAAVVAGTSLAIAVPLARLVATSRGQVCAIAWTLLLAPLLTPTILTGYAWAHAIFALTERSGWNAVIYFSALVLRFTPVAALVLYFVPSPLSAEAAHCFRLAAGSLERWRFRIRGCGIGPWLAVTLVFLLAFGEFELAAMWNYKTWTVALFDAQAGGLALQQTLWLSAFPTLCQFAVLLVLLLVARRAPLGDGSGNPRHFPRSIEAGAWLYLVGAAALLAFFPVGKIATQAMTGWSAISGNLVLGRDILAGMFFAIGAAVLAQATCATAPRRVALCCMIAAPGLLGGLVLSMLALALFQSPLLRALYDSPIPLLAVLTMCLVPLALALRGLLVVFRPAPALHLASMLGSRRLRWYLEGRPRWWAFFLLFCWGYFEFTASSILAPIGMTPVFVRLHNLSHYGQTAVLSAMLCAALVVPPAVLLLTAAARELYARARGE